MAREQPSSGDHVDVIGVNVGERASEDKEKQFQGLRAELNWKAREMLVTPTPTVSGRKMRTRKIDPLPTFRLIQ